MTNVAVIYYSSTGNVHALASAVAEGAEDAGAEVRLRRVAELAPAEAIDSNPAWRAHADATADIAEATHDDLRWADAYAFGTPTRSGNVSSSRNEKDHQLEKGRTHETDDHDASHRRWRDAGKRQRVGCPPRTC